jgi:hypothetical protein
MDLVAILSEKQSSKNVKLISTAAIEDASIVKALIQLMDKGSPRLSQNAAWPICHITDANPFVFAKHQKKLLSLLKRTDVHPAVHRNVIRIFHYLKVDTKLEGELLDICFHFLDVKETPIAVQHLSMHILLKMTKQYPELLNEFQETVKMIVQQNPAPAFKYIAKKMELL